MRKINWKTAISVLAYAALIIVLYFLQGVVFARLPLFGAKPVLLLPAVVCVAMHGGTVRGGAFGIFAGVMCDVTFEQPAMMCTMLFVIIGVLAGMLAEGVLMRSFPAYVLMSAGALVIMGAVQMFPLLVYDGVGFMPLFFMMLKQLLSTMVFVIPVYYLCRLAAKVAYSAA